MEVLVVDTTFDQNIAATGNIEPQLDRSGDTFAVNVVVPDDCAAVMTTPGPIRNPVPRLPETKIRQIALRCASSIATADHHTATSVR
jgi:hypothetical protein